MLDNTGADIGKINMYTEKVKDMLCRLFRYKSATIMLVVGFIASFVSLYYGNRGIYRYNQSQIESDRNDYKYVSKSTFQGNELPIDELILEMNGNCMIYGLYMTVDYLSITTGIWVVLYNNEDITIPVSKGNFPTESDIENEIPPVMIGKDYSSAVFSENGKDYIVIQSEKYLVTGYLGGEISREYDDRILIFADNMGKKAKKLLCSDCTLWGLDFVFCSNYYNVYKDSETIGKRLKRYGKYTIREAEYEVYAENREERDLVYYVIFAYSVLIIGLVSVNWINERDEEFRIRVAFGTSKGQIMLIVMKSIIVLFLLAVCVSLCIVSLVNRLTDDFMNRPQDEAGLFMFTGGVHVIGICLAMIIYPLYRTKKGWMI